MNLNQPGNTHDVLRSQIRDSSTIIDFLNVLTQPDMKVVLQSLLDAQSGRDQEAWARFWAEALSRNEEWAWNLNHCRKTCTLFIFELHNSWNPQKGSGQTVTADEIIARLQPTLSIMYKACLVMDRASAMYNMIDIKDNLRGMHWYAENPDHRQTLQAQGALAMDQNGGHTMNKRYLYLMEGEFLPLGLAQDADIQRWTTPHPSPLRVLATASTESQFEH